MAWNRDARSWKPLGLRPNILRKRLSLQGDLKEDSQVPGASVLIFTPRKPLWLDLVTVGLKESELSSKIKEYIAPSSSIRS